MMNHVWLDLLSIDLNPVKLEYYPFMISLDKCSGRWNVLSSTICVPKKNKKRVKKMLKYLI